MTAYGAPSGLPVLSRGKHRNPRKGACFMELASVLADEPWSDAPRCTHPLLASLARLVNDASSDDSRSELAVMVPDVVGVRGGGFGWEVTFVSAVACHAVLDVPEELQRALAAGLLRCQELAVALGPGAVDGADEIAAALDRVPGATSWARGFAGGRLLSEKQFRSRSAPAMLRCAVRGVAIVAPDPDAALRELLAVGIATARRTPTGTDRSPTPHWRGQPARARAFEGTA